MSKSKRILRKFELFDTADKQDKIVKQDICQLCRSLMGKVTWSDGLHVNEPEKLIPIDLVLNTVIELDHKELMQDALPWAFASVESSPALDIAKARYDEEWLASWCVSTLV